MNAIVTFLNENSGYIAIVIAIVVGLLVYISFNNINLNQTTTQNLTQTVTVETFEPMDNKGTNLPQDTDFSGANSFCETHSGNSHGLNIACKGLTNENCASSACCVLVKGQHGNTCMAGGVNGPTFKKDATGNMISMDAYYYEGKQYVPTSPTPM
jgi:hypothetical protein